MPTPQIKILFLAANPSDEARLRLGAESTKIKEALEAATSREHFLFVEDHAVRLDSLTRLILRQKPTIVHFSGHGAVEGSLIFEEQGGIGVEADPTAIAELFRLAGDNTKLIILNACHSEGQAKALANHVDAVIGISKSVSDDSAIAFSKALYEAIGEGCSVSRAFLLAKNYVVLQGLPDAELPVLIERPGAVANSLLLLPPR